LHLDDTIAGFAAISGTISPEVREALRVALDAAAALGPNDPDDDRSMAQRRHDALGDLATHYLASHHKLADTAGERPRVIVTVDYATLMATLESDARTKWAMLESGLRLSPEAARRLACDAEILPSVLGSRS